MNVLTLIAPDLKLRKDFVDSIVKNINATKIDWLAGNEACDLYLDSNTAPKIEEKGVDAIFQSAENRKKKLLISDMDSTIITIECVDEIADFVGMKQKVSEITDRAMNGEIDFRQALVERVALLKGLPSETLNKVYNERVKFMGGAAALVSTMRKNGAYALLVSGGFTYFTGRVSEDLGFQENHANILVEKEGKLTGEVVFPILDKASKLQSLEKKIKELNIEKSDVLAVGDGANDLPMLLAAGLGVAYHAKPKVKEQTKAKIEYCDLKALLYAQGYKKAEITEGR